MIKFRDANSKKKIKKFWSNCISTFKSLIEEIEDENVVACDLYDQLMEDYKSIFGKMNLAVNNFTKPKDFLKKFYSHILSDDVKRQLQMGAVDSKEISQLKMEYEKWKGEREAKDNEIKELKESKTELENSNSANKNRISELETQLAATKSCITKQMEQKQFENIAQIAFHFNGTKPFEGNEEVFPFQKFIKSCFNRTNYSEKEKIEKVNHHARDTNMTYEDFLCLLSPVF